MSDEPSGRRQARGEIETLPSGSLRVRVYAGIDPVTRRRRYRTETVSPGPYAAEQAESVRRRLLAEVREVRARRAGADAAPGERPSGPAEPAGPDAQRDLDPVAAAENYRPRPRGELTAAAIARLAGVSPPTVSKVLNGRPGVAPETRRRVEELLRDRGYRRRDRTARAACVEVAFYGALSYAVVEMLRGVKQVAVARGLTVGFTDVQNEAATGRNWAQDLLARHPTGVIAVHLNAMPEQHGLLNVGAIPLVVVDPVSEPLDPVPSVSAANRRGGAAAAQHLLGLGHRRIGVLTGPLDRLGARDRFEGVRTALAAGRAPLDDSLVRFGMWFSYEEGVSHGRDLLRLAAPPTAVVCGNDLQAFGLFEAARQVGLRIPQDLSVVGFDDISYARWSGPPLTTVRQPFTEMGSTATRMVLALADDESIAQSHIELATTLVVRDSTAVPRRA